MESVIVYTGCDLRQMRENGGSGHWVANPIRVEAAQYLICVRNRREHLAVHDFEHGTAFLIAKIKSTKPSSHASRIIIEFGEFASVAIPGAWNLLTNGQRCPIGYLETAEAFRRLHFSPDDLAWQSSLENESAPAPGAPTTTYSSASPSNRQTDAAFSDLIRRSKLGLAGALGITIESIEITVRL